MLQPNARQKVFDIDVVLGTRTRTVGICTELDELALPAMRALSAPASSSPIERV